MGIHVSGNRIITTGKIGAVTYGNIFELTNKQTMDLLSAKKDAQGQSKQTPGRVFYIDIDGEGECSVNAGQFTDGASAYAYKGGNEIPLPNAEAKEAKKKKPSAKELTGAVMEILDSPAPPTPKVKKAPAKKASNKNKNNKKSEDVKLDNSMEKTAAKKPVKKGSKKAAKKVAKKARAKGERVITPVQGTKKTLTIASIRKELKAGKVIRKESGWYFSEAWTNLQTDQARKYDVYVK